jgi:hypothetical protein
LKTLVQKNQVEAALAHLERCKPLPKDHSFPFKRNCVKRWEAPLGSADDGHTGKLALSIKNGQGENCNVLWLQPDPDNLENVQLDYLALSLNGNYVKFKGNKCNARTVLVTANPITAMALSEVTGYDVACTLKPYNMADVVKIISERDPSLQFVICDDTPYFLGHQDYRSELRKLPQVCFLAPPTQGFYEKTQSNPTQLKVEIDKVVTSPKEVDDDVSASFAIAQHSMARVGSETLFEQVTNIVLRYVSMPAKMAPILAAYI